jgi:hypothetical protein
MLLTDGLSGCKDTYFLANKKSGTTLQAFKLYLAKVERQTGKKVRIVRIDGGGEFEGDWTTFCTEKGIIIESTPPYFSSANGVAERGIRTVIGQTRSNDRVSQGIGGKECDADVSRETCPRKRIRL